jgi:hypothetical protein
LQRPLLRISKKKEFRCEIGNHSWGCPYGFGFSFFHRSLPSFVCGKAQKPLCFLHLFGDF